MERGGETFVYKLTFKPFMTFYLWPYGKWNIIKRYKKGKVIPVTGHESHRVETSWLPHFLDNRLAYGNEAVSLMRCPSFTPQEDSWYSFLLEADSNPGP
jgi:hypothetical protein